MDKYNADNNDGKIIEVKGFGWFCKYWRPAVTVDAVFFVYGELDENSASREKALQILLVKRSESPDEGKWALPGGFMVEKDESAEAAAVRVLKKEAGVVVKEEKLKPLGAFSKKKRDRRDHIISIPFYALMLKDIFKIKGGIGVREAKWFPISDVLANRQDLAFDHKEIIDAALKKLQQSVYVEPIARDLLDEKFTITEIYNLYFSILYPGFNEMDEEKRARIETKFNRSNFIKKINRLGFIKKTKETVKNTPHRQPVICIFNQEEFDNLKDHRMFLEFDFRKISSNNESTKKKKAQDLN